MGASQWILLRQSSSCVSLVRADLPFFSLHSPGKPPLSAQSRSSRHQSEVRALVNYKIWREHRDITDPDEFPTSSYDRPTMRKCWDFLDQTSRSFSMVIKDLEGDLARTVRLFLEYPKLG